MLLNVLVSFWRDFRKNPKSSLRVTSWLHPERTVNPSDDWYRWEAELRPAPLGSSRLGASMDFMGFLGFLGFLELRVFRVFRIFRVFRVFRVLRVFRVFRVFRGF